MAACGSPPRCSCSLPAPSPCASARSTPAIGSTRRSRSGSPRTSRARYRACSARTARRRSTTCCCTAGWRWWATARRPRARCRSSSRPRRCRRRGGRRGGRRAGAVAAGWSRSARSSRTTRRRRGCTRWSRCCRWWRPPRSCWPPRGACWWLALTLLLYTHTWGVFLAAALGVAWLGRATSRARRRAASARPSSSSISHGRRASPSRPSTPARPGRSGPSVPAPALAAALAVARRPRGDGPAARPGHRRGVALAWVASQVEPAWSPRYLAVLFGPALIALAWRRAAPRWAVAAPAVAGRRLAARRSAGGQEQRPRRGRERGGERSRRRPRGLHAARAGARPAPLPAGRRRLPDAAGHAADPSFTDWRDALPRVRAARAGRVLLPRVHLLAAGRLVVLVMPVARRARSPWSRAVRRRTLEWRAALNAEPRLRWVGRTSHPDPTRFRSTVRAEIFEVLR